MARSSHETVHAATGSDLLGDHFVGVQRIDRGAVFAGDADLAVVLDHLGAVFEGEGLHHRDQPFLGAAADGGQGPGAFQPHAVFVKQAIEQDLGRDLGIQQLVVGQGGEHGFAGGAVVAEDAHLDEAVRLERAVHFLLDGGGEAIATDHDHGVEVVGFGPVHFALGGGELYLRHGTIIPVKVKTNSKKVNKAWLNDHVNDPYVKLAQKDGYRARAAYKLKEIDESLHLIRPGDTVVDLGSAPGAWSQYLRRRLSPQGAAVGELNGRIIALDLLPMEAIEGVHFIQGDFREAEVLQALEGELGRRGVQKVDLVVSDMAPNLSGIGDTDAARIADLIDLAVDFSRQWLRPDGAPVVKLFHGGAYEPTVALFRKTFRVVKPVKPKASRDKSSETFLVGLGLKPL